MKILYIGAVEFSHHCLREVLKNKGEVVGVVTSNTSKVNSDYMNLQPIADENNIPTHFFKKTINDKETIEWIKLKEPDVIFCFGLSQLIKKELLEIPPLGIVGTHPALLPRNRGRHPLIWTLVLNEKEGGLTFFFMDEGMDSGDILSQRSFTVCESDNASSLYEKVKHSASVQIKEFLPMLMNGSYNRMKQDDKLANYLRKRGHKDGVIDWRMSTNAILNLVRALTRPYIGAEFYYNHEYIKVWKVSEYKDNLLYSVEPGKVIQIEGGKPIVKTYDGSIMIEEWEPKVELVIDEYL